jgi:hypothetical protein
VVFLARLRWMLTVMYVGVLDVNSVSAGYGFIHSIRKKWQSPFNSVVIGHRRPETAKINCEQEGRGMEEIL